MSTSARLDEPHAPAATAPASLTLVTLTVDGQACGLPVDCVRDVLAGQTIAPIPLASPEIAGNLNLRGRIVTAIDLRRRLRLPPRDQGASAMSVVTEQAGECYALLVDHVADVVSLQSDRFEAPPPTLPPCWAETCAGVVRQDDGLLVVLDPARLLALPRA
jgi:purine-binding chemotaxis protein CheW